MTTDSDLTRVLERWLDDGPTHMPDRVVDVVAERIAGQRQRPARRPLTWRPHPMSTPLRFAAAIAALVAVLVGGTIFLGGGGSAPALSPSPSATATVIPSASAGVAGACDLMTAEEAGNAMHISSLVTTESRLHPDSEAVAPTVPTPFCNYGTGAGSLFVLRYEPGTGADAFAIWQKTPGVEPVSGLGDDAAWAPARSMLYILKGDRLVTVMPPEGPDPTLTLEVATAIGEIVVTRM